MAELDLTRRTKIVATIGPATESPERIRELVQAGATTFRLNFSHGDHSEHATRIATIRQVAHELGVHIGILQDLQGCYVNVGLIWARVLIPNRLKYMGLENVEGFFGIHCNPWAQGLAFGFIESVDPGAQGPHRPMKPMQ